MKKLNKRTLMFVLTTGLIGAAALAGPGRLMPRAQAWCDYSAEYSAPECDGGADGSVVAMYHNEGSSSAPSKCAVLANDRWQTLSPTNFVDCVTLTAEILCSYGYDEISMTYDGPDNPTPNLTGHTYFRSSMCH